MTPRCAACLVAALTCALDVSVRAQEPLRAFEAVSIRRSTNPDTDFSFGTRPGGRYVLVNASIISLVRAAYPVESSEYIGGPDWLRNERYDVTAIGPAGTERADIEPMLRTLLAERFHFKGRYETEVRAVYNLVLARGDGKLPPGLRRIDIDCEARRDANVRGDKPPELPRLPSGILPCSIAMSYSDAVTVRSGGRTMAEFAQIPLTAMTERVVVDKTGLEGYYEFEVKFTEKPEADTDLPSLFTALQEQVGLKLESARAPVRVFVIDHIERPTEN